MGWWIISIIQCGEGRIKSCVLRSRSLIAVRQGMVQYQSSPNRPNNAKNTQSHTVYPNSRYRRKKDERERHSICSGGVL